MHTVLARGRLRPGLPALLSLLALLVLSSACSPSVRTVRFKVNSEPEGAHVVYRVLGDDVPCQGQWIYLGNTPLRSVRRYSDEQLEHIGKITLKVMRRGYYDQVREWDGPSFLEEAEGRGVIFWTPELVPQPAGD